jgi:hypothetical protein
MTVPEYIDIDAWTGYVEMRRSMGKSAPFTDKAKELTLRKLEDFYRQGYDVNHVLETAIERSWRGVFLTNDTPRRQMNQQDKANQAKVMALVAKVGK